MLFTEWEVLLQIPKTRAQVKKFKDQALKHQQATAQNVDAAWAEMSLLEGGYGIYQDNYVRGTMFYADFDEHAYCE